MIFVYNLWVCVTDFYYFSYLICVLLQLTSLPNRQILKLSFYK